MPHNQIGKSSGPDSVIIWNLLASAALARQALWDHLGGTYGQASPMFSVMALCT